MSIFSNLGFAISETKSVSARLDEPFTHQLRLLGFVVDSDLMEFRCIESRVKDTQRRAEELIGRRFVKARDLLKLTGRLMSFHLVLGPVALLYSRNLFNAVAERESTSWNSRADISSPEAQHELKFIARLLQVHNRTSIIGKESEMIDAVIASDASERETGAWLRVRTGRRYLTRRTGGDDFIGTSSTTRELRGVLHAIQAFRLDIAGKRVIFRMDSRSAFHLLTRGASKKPDAHREVLAVYELLASLDARPVWQWWRRSEGGAVVADEMSKTYDHHDLRCSSALLENLEAWSGNEFDLDVFANVESHIGIALEREIPWCSRWCYAGSLGDGWTMDWGARRHVFLFPPFPLIGECLAQAARQGAKGVMIVPKRPLAAFWPLIAGREHARWVRRPWIKDVLLIKPSQGLISAHSRTEPLREPLWALHFDCSMTT